MHVSYSLYTYSNGRKAFSFLNQNLKLDLVGDYHTTTLDQMHHNLNKYDVIVGLEIPDFRIIPYYKPFSRDPKYCHKWNTGIKTKLLFETCQKIWPAYIGTIAKLDDSQERIKHIMEKEIPAVVPDFKLRPVPTDGN